MYGSTPVPAKDWPDHSTKQLTHVRNDASTSQAPPSAPTTHPLPAGQPTTYSSTAVQQLYIIPVFEGHLVVSRVLTQSETGGVRCGTRGAGWGFPFSYDSARSWGEGEPSPGEPFHAPRSPSWETSAVMSPGTPRGDVRGGRGKAVRSLGAGWRTVAAGHAK